MRVTGTGQQVTQLLGSYMMMMMMMNIFKHGDTRMKTERTLVTV
jgi:hypothetical protein